MQQVIVPPECPVAAHRERDDVFYCCCPTDPAVPQPGVHALLIGVSKYKGDAFKLLRGSAPAATHFARFLLHDFHHPDGIPLRTLRLHLTPGDMTDADKAEYLLTEGKVCPPASYEAVDRALADWAADCDTHPDNIALLFVSGHGLATSEARWAFLPEAGAAGNRYSFGINATALQLGMKPRRARTQIFIWDICAESDGIPDNVGAGGLYLPLISPGPGHPGAVNQVAIMSRLGTETFALNAKGGTVLTDALVGPNEKEFRTRLMATAVTVDTHNNIAVTTKQVGMLLPTAVGPKVAGHPGYVVHVVEPSSAEIGLNRPDPLPIFKVIFVWDGTPASDSLLVTIKSGGKEILPSTELIWTAGEPEVSAHVHLPAGRHRFSAKPSTGDGNSYDVTVEGTTRISAWDGERL